MRKSGKHIEKKLTVMVPSSGMSDTLQFPDQSSEDKAGKNTKDKKDRLGASDLFSLFTADIIKEDVVFTR